MRRRRRVGIEGRRGPSSAHGCAIFDVERSWDVRVKPRILLQALLILAFALAAVPASQGAKQREDPNARSVQGAVKDADGNLAEGAVVQLKNTKSLQVRSYITQEEGTYSFLGLSKDVEYELKADFRGSSSPVKKLGVFDPRKKAIVNLNIEAKQ
jgi:hypothetical protein